MSPAEDGFAPEGDTQGGRIGGKAVQDGISWSPVRGMPAAQSSGATRRHRKLAEEVAMRTPTVILAILAGLFLPLSGALAQTDDPNAYGDDYRAGNFGRIRFQENGSTILRAQPERDVPRENAGGTNAAIFPGDSLTTARDQRVEVQLANGTVVRLDRDSQIQFESLPESGAAFQDNTVLKLAAGVIRISAIVGEKGDFRVDTPAASAYLLGDGESRIEVDTDGTTRVYSHRGVVEVVGDGGSVLVRGGMRTSVDPSSVPGNPRAFNTFAADSFDRWCIDRNQAYRVQDRYADSGGGDPYGELPDEVRPYYGELSDYGQWVNEPTYGWVWSPYAVSAGWRPYYDGYWDYGPGGYFWVSSEPWGWAPYHYGRWNWVLGTGWCWIPGRVFGGAWVSWSWGSAYIGWAPLDFWDRPAFVSTIFYDYYDPHCWSFVDYDHFYSHDRRPHIVPFERVGTSLRGNTVVVRPPRIPPQRLAGAEWRERAVREARDDRFARVPPVSRDRVPDTRFRDVEARMARRDLPGRIPGSRSGAEQGRPATRVGPLPSPARPGTGRPGGVLRSVPSSPRSAPAPRSEPSRGWDRSVPRAPGSGQTAGPPRRDDRTPPASGAGRNDSRSPDGRSRRFLSDPRGGERQSTPPPRSFSPPQGGQGETRSRVREMYQGIARPRETRQSDGGATRGPGTMRQDRPQAPRMMSRPDGYRAHGGQQPRPAAPRIESRPQPRAQSAPHVERRGSERPNRSGRK